MHMESIAYTSGKNAAAAYDYPVQTIVPAPHCSLRLYEHAAAAPTWSGLAPSSIARFLAQQAGSLRHSVCLGVRAGFLAPMGVV